MQNLSNFLLHIINFIVMYAIIRTLVYNPVRKYMDARTARIAAQKTEAESALQTAKQQKEQYRQQLANAQKDVMKLRKESEEQAQAAAEQILSDAHKQSDALLATAQEQVDMQRIAAIDQMRDEFAQVAVQLAAKVLEREVSEQDNKAVIDDFFEDAI